MSGESSSNLRYYSFDSPYNQLSQDTHRPRLTRQSFIAENIEGETIIRQRPSPPAIGPHIIEAEMPDNFLNDPDFTKSFPSGGYSVDYKFQLSGELGIFTLKIFPEIDSGSKKILERVLVGQDTKKRTESIHEFFNNVYWGMSESHGLWLVASGKSAYNLRPDGAVRIGNGFEENDGDIWEGERRYKRTSNGSPTFECTIGKTVYQDYVIDMYNSDIIYTAYPKEYYIVAGMIARSANVSEIISMVEPMLVNGVLTDERLREIVMPYVYLMPVVDTQQGYAESDVLSDPEQQDD